MYKEQEEIMQDEDEVVMLVEHDEYMQKFFVTISTGKVLEMNEFAACLRSLAEDIDKDPDQFLNSFTNAEFDCH